MTGVKNYVQCHRLAMVLVCCFCLMIGCATAIIIGRTQAQPYWIVFGGNTDPGDGNGGGLAKQQFIDAGWTTPDRIFQVTWNARIEQGTVQQSDAAQPAGMDAYNRFCGDGNCIIAGFSLGNSPALQLSDAVGHPAELTYVFGGPQPSTGVWHQQYQDNPIVQPWIQTVGRLNPDRLTRPGMKAFYDTHDPYANAAPQCSGPGLFALNINPGHRIIRRDEPQQVWVGPDGVEMHEAARAPLPLSGADPSPFWAGCLNNDWRTTFNSPGAGVPESNVQLPTELPTGIPTPPR
ncbi:hypothetical protein SEA_NOSHOW_33 [Mycobacterium phage NoShow]|nr:hypothetical protein SEA_NOSHOW_33 [Mycobacterium phage NoShow]